MVDAEAGVALPAAGGIVPEGVEPRLVGVEGAERVGPAVVEDSAPGGAASRAASARRAAIARTEKTSRSSGMTFQSPASTAGRSSASNSRGVRAQPLHPAQLVVELLGADRIAVGQVDRADDQRRRLRPRYSGCGCRRDRRAGPCGAAPAASPRAQDGDAVEALLAVPDGAIAGAPRCRAIGSDSSAHFSSCRQATSGFSRSSHSSRRGRRARMPLRL